MADTAKITAELAGASQVAAEADKIESRLNRLGSAASRGLGGAAKSIAGSMGNLLQTGLTTAGVLQTLSLGNAIEDAKKLDLITARLGQTAGTSGTALKTAFDKSERSTLTSSLAMADFAKSLQRTTGDGKFAAAALASLGDEALAFGKDLSEELPLAAALHNMGVESSKVSTELGRVRDMAEKVGTVGGPQALNDTIAALGPALAGVSMGSDAARARLEALFAVSTKGLRPEQAKGVSAALLATVRSRASDIQRVTGRAVLNDNNELIADEIPRALQALQTIARKRFGKNKDAQKRALMADFGADAGLAIYRTDFSQVNSLGATASDKGKTAAEAEAFRQSTDGQRLAAGLKTDQDKRNAGEKFLGVADYLQKKLGTGGAMLAGLFGGQVAVGAGKAVLGAGARALMGSGAAAAAGAAPAAAGGGLLSSAGQFALKAGKLVAGAGATAGRAVIGAGGNAIAAAGGGAAIATGAGVLTSMAGPALAVLADIGEDRNSMGKRYRSEHAQLLGSELASAAQREGSLVPVIGRAQGDTEVIAAALEKLALSMEHLQPGLAAQVTAGLQNAKIVAKLPLDPNAPKGN